MRVAGDVLETESSLVREFELGLVMGVVHPELHVRKPRRALTPYSREERRPSGLVPVDIDETQPILREIVDCLCKIRGRQTVARRPGLRARGLAPKRGVAKRAVVEIAAHGGKLEILAEFVERLLIVRRGEPMARDPRERGLPRPGWRPGTREQEKGWQEQPRHESQHLKIPHK